MSQHLNCDEWPGAKNDRGYGVKTVNGKTVYVHRLAYCEHNHLDLEDIAGLKVRHSCDNPPCRNPEHLLLGTQTDNMRDMANRRRHPKHRMSDDELVAIRAEYVRGSKEHGQPALAKKYGFSQTHISRTIQGNE